MGIENKSDSSPIQRSLVTWLKNKGVFVAPFGTSGVRIIKPASLGGQVQHANSGNSAITQVGLRHFVSGKGEFRFYEPVVYPLVLLAAPPETGGVMPRGIYLYQLDHSVYANVVHGQDREEQIALTAVERATAKKQQEIARSVGSLNWPQVGQSKIDGHKKLTKFVLDQCAFVEKLPGLSEVGKAYRVLQHLDPTLVAVENHDIPVIFDTLRRDRVYIPYAIDEDQGVYVHPWLAGPSQVSATGSYALPSVLVTAVCLCGSNLIAIGNLGTRRQLMKHDIQLYPGEKIVDITYDDTAPNPFKTLQDHMQAQIAKLFSKISKDVASKRVVCHAPDWDYVLFATSLFLKRQMDRKALGLLIYYVRKERERVQQSVVELYQGLEHLTVRVLSPFDGVFLACADKANKIILDIDVCFEMGDADMEDQVTTHFQSLAAEVLNLLELNDVDEGNVDQVAVDETKLVRRVVALAKQCGEDALPKVWHDFLAREKRTENLNSPSMTMSQCTVEEGIKTVEQLFDVANPIVLGVASYGCAPGAVVSALPSAEKPIQVEYHKLTRDDLVGVSYPSICCLTLFEPVVATTGITFNCAPEHASAYNEFFKQELGIISREIATKANLVVSSRFEQLTPSAMAASQGKVYVSPQHATFGVVTQEPCSMALGGGPVLPVGEQRQSTPLAQALVINGVFRCSSVVVSARTSEQTSSPRPCAEEKVAGVTSLPPAITNYVK